MWPLDSLQIGNRIALLIGQLLVLLACVGYFVYLYSIHILPDKRANVVFQQTECFLISKRLSTAGGLLKRYRADFLVTYNVKKVQYNRWVSGNGLDMTFSPRAAKQKQILSAFDAGGTYTCWYDPNDPQLAMLVARNNWLSAFSLIMPSLIGVIMLYYFLQNVLQLWRMMINNNRQEK